MGNRKVGQDYAVDARLTERWRAKVDMSDHRGCWLWQGSVMHNSRYGQIHVKLRNGSWSATVAHRVAYEIYRGPIPEGLVLDHLCRNRQCVNPSHLEAVENRTNILRGTGFAAHHARKSHCPQGHEYGTENTYLDKGGMRHCRACGHDRYLARKEART